MMAMSAVAFGQGEPVAKFLAKYSSDESFGQVNVSSKMFAMFTDLEGSSPEDKAIMDAISKLKGMKILTKDDARNARELYKEALSVLPPKDYEELMSVRDDDKDMKFFVREAGAPGKIAELVMVVGGNDEFMMLTLFGEIDLKQISKIASSMKIDGMENLERIHEKDKKELKEKKNDE